MPNSPWIRLLLFMLPAIGGCGGDRGSTNARLEDPDPRIRREAIRDLASANGATGDALPHLLARLEDGDSSVRVAAALAIHEFDPTNAACRPVIETALLQGQGPVFLAIAAEGPKSEWAVPTLLTLMQDRRPAIRALSARSLGEIAPKDTRVVKALRRGLRDESRAVRRACEQAVEHVTTTAAPNSS